jgi:hypothetical protein
VYLTDDSYDVVEFQNSFFVLHLSFDCTFLKQGVPLIGALQKPAWLKRYGFEDSSEKWTENPDMVNTAKNQFFCIGFKNAIDCISSLQDVHNQIIINELFQDKYNRHSFVFNQVKSYSQKENKILFGKMFASVCGVYISYWELYQQTVNSNVQKIKFGFDVNINFDDLIIFENMYEYPSSILGKLESKLKVSPNAFFSMVLCRSERIFVT